jgi:hypothetical protein
MAIKPQAKAQALSERESRLRQVAALRLAGVRDQSTIAQRLNVSAATMCRDFAEVDARWRVEAAADIDAAKVMLLGIWQDATRGKWLAIDRALHILERRAAIYGYDAPKRSELTGANGGPLEVEQHGDLPDTERAERLTAFFELIRARLAGPAGEALPMGALARPADAGLSQ